MAAATPRVDSQLDLSELAKRAVSSAVTVKTSWEDIAKTAVLVGAGSGITYATMLATGHAPLWFGPERREWSSDQWGAHANRVMAELTASASYALHMPRSSDRNYLAAEPDSHRRVRRALFYSSEERCARGVVKFGADVEGPPRHVHGGCIAATADQLMGIFVMRLWMFPVVTASLTVDYREKIPLGSQLGFEIHAAEGSDLRKSTVLLRFFSVDPSDGPAESRVFAEARAVFVNTLLPSAVKSLL